MVQRPLAKHQLVKRQLVKKSELITKIERSIQQDSNSYRKSHYNLGRDGGLVPSSTLTIRI